MFQHPVITAEIGGAKKDIWVGDLVKTDQLLMLVERFFTLNHSNVMAKGYEVARIDHKLVLQNMPEKTAININEIRYIVCDDPESLTLELEPLFRTIVIFINLVALLSQNLRHQIH